MLIVGQAADQRGDQGLMPAFMVVYGLIYVGNQTLKFGGGGTEHRASSWCCAEYWNETGAIV